MPPSLTRAERGDSAPLTAVRAHDRRAGVEEEAGHHITSRAPSLSEIEARVSATLLAAELESRPRRCRAATFAPEAASISIASVPWASSRARSGARPASRARACPGRRPRRRRRPATVPPDQIGVRVVSPAGHSTKTRLPTGGTAARPTPEPAYGLHGRHHPVVSSPKTSGTRTRSRDEPARVVVVDDDAEVLAVEAVASQQTSQPADAERLVAGQAERVAHERHAAVGAARAATTWRTRWTR